MTDSFVMVLKLNMYALLGIMYLYGIGILASLYKKDVYNVYGIKLTYAIPFILLAGLPPVPLFFCKAWSIGYLVRTVWGIGFFILFFCNTILLGTYLTTINDSESCDELQNFNFLTKPKLDWILILKIILFFIFTPKLFLIF
jgi:hypothetical protein